ncbi:hypothetical protein DV737_g3727, partial [Chaetothyriales sp. CBS 132003]
MRTHTPVSAATAPTAAPGSDYPDDPSFDGVPAAAGDDHPTRIEMNQDEIDAIIRNKRKVRDPKACYACHRRKVKCNRELPCDSCVKRDHPELCSYERPTKKRRIALSTVGPAERGAQAASRTADAAAVGPSNRASISINISTANSTPIGVRDDKEDAEPEGILAPSDQMGSIHLGSRSVLAYMIGLGRSGSTPEAARLLLEENVLPKLGLDNESVTYPFVDLWSTDTSIGNIDGLCSAIPDDGLCKDLYQFYRDVACTMYPVVPEPDRFEETLDFMLANRAKAVRENLEIDQAKPLGIPLTYLALVFAVLASGSQCSRLGAKERELTSQVYTCCSYQALRMSNFMTHPCLETIQASLIISNVLAYNMNPGVAYIFLGMVIRMAFSIGLHMNSGPFGEHEAWLRRRVWWALAWQDSHFSISYDRPTSTAMCAPDIPYARGSRPGNRSYAETMYSIIQLTQEIIRHRAINSRATMSWATIQRYRDRVAAIVADGAPHLRDASLCLNVAQHVERLVLKVHTAYIISEVCRPALEEHVDDPLPSSTTPLHSPTTLTPRRASSTPNARLTPGPADANLVAQLRRDCIAHLEATAATYVELYAISEFAARNWILIQRTVSAAFLLGVSPQVNQESRILQLLREFRRCIAHRIREGPTFDDLDPQPSASPAVAGSAANLTAPHSGQGPRWASTMVKSLNVLGKLSTALNDQRLGTPKRRPNASNGTKPTNVPANMPGNMAANMSANMPGNMAANMSANVPANYPQVSHLQHHLRPHAHPNPPPPANSHIHFPPPQLSAPTQTQDYSPNMGMARVGHAPSTLGPITPDSTASASSDWNYANLTERTSNYVQPPLWG